MSDREMRRKRREKLIYIIVFVLIMMYLGGCLWKFVAEKRNGFEARFFEEKYDQIQDDGHDSENF